MYDQTTWADIARYEQAIDEAEVGTCEYCGRTGWLALYDGDRVCTDCEAEEILTIEAHRINDRDEGVTWEDEY